MTATIVYVDQYKVDPEDMTILTPERIAQMDNLNCYFPPHTRDGLIRWIEWGIYPGGFLTAVIEDKLSQAFGQADETNSIHMRGIVSWIWNYAPSDCWGSQEKVAAWSELRKTALEELRSKKKGT